MNRVWFAGIAAIALSSAPAWAQGKGNGGGHGGGNDHGGGRLGAPQHGNRGGGDHGSGGHVDSGDRSGGEGNTHGGPDGSQAMMAAPSPEHGNGRRHGQGNAMREERRVGTGHSARGAEAYRDDPRAQAGYEGRAEGRRERDDNGYPNNFVSEPRPGPRENPGHGDDKADAAPGKPAFRSRSDADTVQLRQVFAMPRRGPVDGCPPGLAAKNNGCRPPGQAREQDRLFGNSLYRPDWWGYSRLDAGRYAYDNGYLYRLDDSGGVAGYVPLLGGALGIGNGWPDYYQPVELPAYYQRYYGLGPADTYRYADDVIYRVDPANSAITSIAALLTGDSFTIGQRLPPGYDIYNVPAPYRAQYRDAPGRAYRYSDGYVYQVDPRTQLITAAIELLSGTTL